MTSLTPDSLYALLPALHRIRDEAQGGPLRALLAVVAEQGVVVENDIERLLDNWFIETCDEWVVPYIGDLLGVRGLHALPSSAGFSQRARVANTLSYRRRKGTATMLEQLARDTTGWPARVVEFFEILGWNQHLNHVRRAAVRTPDLRFTSALELLNTAFDTTTRSVDIRHVAHDHGRHNLPSVGIFLWRLQSYFIPGTDARPAGAGFYSFHAVANQNRPIFNRPQTETEMTQLADDINVPGPLRRRPLHDELEKCRAQLLAGSTPRGTWFGPRPVLQVYQQTSAVPPFAYTPIPPEQIRLCHLGAGAVRPDPTNSAGQPILVGIDPVLGRLAWADTRPLPIGLKVGFAYGFSGDLGGGPYNRHDSVQEALALAAEPNWRVGVSKDHVSVNPAGTDADIIHPTIADAIAEWNGLGGAAVGVITIMDSHTYAENLAISIPEGSQLLIVAADWPVVPKSGGGSQRRRDQLNPVDVRPHLLGTITVVGSAPAGSDSAGALVLDGLLIEGSLTVGSAPGNLGHLRLSHCTLVPAQGGLSVSGRNAGLSVQLIRTICGPITLPATGPSLVVEDCILDGVGTETVLNAVASTANVQSSTLFGGTKVRRLDAGHSLFTGPILAARRQEGCLRFCFVPVSSTTGRRYRCQPDLAVAAAVDAAKIAGEAFDAAELAAVQARVVPVFNAEVYGDPAYAQLAVTCPSELSTGAEDGAEMGAFHFLQQPQREANLRESLDEYLRHGLEAGLIFST